MRTYPSSDRAAVATHTPSSLLGPQPQQHHQQVTSSNRNNSNNNRYGGLSTSDDVEMLLQTMSANDSDSDSSRDNLDLDSPVSIGSIPETLTDENALIGTDDSPIAAAAKKKKKNKNIIVNKNRAGAATRRQPQQQQQQRKVINVNDDSVLEEDGDDEPLDNTTTTTKQVHQQQQLEPCLVSACEHVERLLEQITVMDAPPSNEEREQQLVQQIQQQIQQHAASAVDGQQQQQQSNSSPDAEDNTKKSSSAGAAIGMILPQSSSTSSSSTSSPVANRSTTITSSSFEDDTNSNGIRGMNAGILRQQQQQQQPITTNSAAAAKVGHSSLVALCSWTLEQVQGKPYSPPTPATATPASATTPTAQQQQPQLTITPKNSSSSRTKPTTAASAAAKRIFPWKKHASSTSDNEEKKVDDSSTPTTTTNATAAAPPPPPPSGPRLQQFASEYARHLSKSSLAPFSSPSPAAAHLQQPGSTPPLPPTSAAAAASSAANRRFYNRSGGSNHNNNQHQPLPSPSPSPTTSSSTTTGAAIQLLEDADTAVLTGALLDICITYGENEPPPRGYHRISQTASGRPIPHRFNSSSYNINNNISGSGGGGNNNCSSINITSSSSKKQMQKRWYLNVKKEVNWDKAAQRPTITAVCLIFPDRGEFVPPGFCVVKTPNKVPANLNENVPGNQAERCYLVFRRSRECNPLTGLVPLVPPEAVPPGYTVVERTPRDHVANIHHHHSGGGSIAPSSSSSHSHGPPPLFLAYRQRLAHLEALRPLPLVRAAQPNLAGADFLNDDESSLMSSYGQATRLMAYYATGGTTVRSDVGRFHILDRSTHSLLSPSSVANRLALIQLSRQSSDNKAKNTTSSSSSNANFDLDETGHGSTSSIGGGGGGDANNNSISVNSHNDESDRHPTTGILEYNNSSNMQTATEPVPAYILSHFLKSSLSLQNDYEDDDHHDHINDASLQLALEAMSFIPVIETATCSSSGDNIITNNNGIITTAAAQGQRQFRLQARCALLTPLLTACYIRHGGGALVAVEALTKLLTSTTFFNDDYDLTTDDHESSRRLTLLDISLQAVCDVATSSASETCFSDCVDFVQQAINVCEGKLNTRTIGYVVRFYLFVFYFGASVPCQSSQKWPNPNWTFPSTKKGNIGDDDSIAGRLGSSRNNEDEECRLLEDPRTDYDDGRRRGYLPGGAPQAAALALKELITLSIVRLGKVSVSGMAEFFEAEQKQQLDTSNELSELQEEEPQQPMASFLEGIVSGLIDDAVCHVDRANYTQLAYYQIHRSGGSELFWHDMVNTCGTGLFKVNEHLGTAGRDIYIMIFAVLANLVKVSSGKMRPNNKSDRSTLLSRDTASKLLSFELLLHFLEYWNDEQEAVTGIVPGTPSSNSNGTSNSVIDRRSVDTLAFSIRRMVVPSLLSNTRCGLEDPQVFSRILRIVSELWCSPVYRRHCKVELGILFEHFGLKVLQLGPQLCSSKSHLDLWSNQAHLSLLAQQVEVIKEMKHWFSSDPKDVIELFLNYDTDMCSEITGPIQLMPGTQWQIFQRICSGLSNIAEQCGELIGKLVIQNQSKIMYHKPITEGLSELLDAMNEKSSGKGKGGAAVDEKAVREAARLLRKTSLETISQIVKSLAVSAAASTGNQYTSLLLSWCTPTDAPSVGNFLQSLSASNSASTPESNSSINKPLPDKVNKSATPTRKKQQFGKDEEVLRFWSDAIAADQQERLAHAVPSSQESRQVALEIAKRKSLKKAIEYLIACNALSPSPRDIANFLRINKESFDPTALGNFLSEGEVMAGGTTETEYWNSIRHVYVRAISFVGQTIEEGLRHFLTSCGFRLPGEAQRVDRIMTTFAKCYYEDNAGDSQRCPFKHEDTVYLVSFAIIMLNTDLHKSGNSSGGQAKSSRKKMTKTEFVNNLRGAEQQGEDISREYLISVYESIDANPIELHASDDSSFSDGIVSKSGEERAGALQDMLNNVRSADSLLRGLAVHDFHFATIDDFVSGLDYDVEHALGDLARSCVSKTWHQWHGVINTGLETAHLDPSGMEPSVDILLYALCLTVCLDMQTERAAFLSQLGRLKSFEARLQGHWVSTAERNSDKEEEWYQEIEKACSGSNERKLWALRTIYQWMLSLKAALQVDVENKSTMSSIVRQIKDGDYLLQDPARSFLRDGLLLKKSSRTGRHVQYRFVLFSDVLLYASEEPDGRYKIHEELPLHLLKVVDWFPPSFKNRKLTFEVSHPRKSFFVICSSPKERKSWVQQIKAAVTVEMDRKMKVEAARMAAYTR